MSRGFEQTHDHRNVSVDAADTLTMSTLTLILNLHVNTLLGKREVTFPDSFFFFILVTAAPLFEVAGLVYSPSHPHA